MMPMKFFFFSIDKHVNAAQVEIDLKSYVPASSIASNGLNRTLEGKASKDDTPYVNDFGMRRTSTGDFLLFFFLLQPKTRPWERGEYSHHSFRTSSKMNDDHALLYVTLASQLQRGLFGRQSMKLDGTRYSK